jgi:hypothetical protein
MEEVKKKPGKQFKHKIKLCTHYEGKDNNKQGISIGKIILTSILNDLSCMPRQKSHNSPWKGNQCA